MFSYFLPKNILTWIELDNCYTTEIDIKAYETCDPSTQSAKSGS